MHGNGIPLLSGALTAVFNAIVFRKFSENCKCLPLWYVCVLCVQVHVPRVWVRSHIATLDSMFALYECHSCTFLCLLVMCACIAQNLPLHCAVGGRMRLLVSGGAPLSVTTHQFLRVCFGAPVVRFLLLKLLLAVILWCLVVFFFFFCCLFSSGFKYLFLRLLLAPPWCVFFLTPVKLSSGCGCSCSSVENPICFFFLE